MKKLNLIKKVMIVLILIRTQSLLSQIKYPEINKYGYGIEVFSPANGHGTFYSVYLDIYRGNNVFSVGPTIQKRSMLMNGFKVTYSRSLSKGLMNLPDDNDEPDEDSVVAESKQLEVDNQDHFDRFQVNFLSSFQYNDKLPLSYKLAKDEDLMQRGEPSINFNAVMFSTVEFTAGFSLQININRCLNWKSYIGTSVYYHLNYLHGMDHERIAPVLNLGTGLSFVLD